MTDLERESFEWWADDTQCFGVAKAGAWAGWLARARVAGAPPVSIPEGWALVPVEPTMEMQLASKAADKEYQARMGLTDAFQVGGYDHYRAMIAAAPKPADHFADVRNMVAGGAEPGRNAGDYAIIPDQNHDVSPGLELAPETGDRRDAERYRWLRGDPAVRDLMSNEWPWCVWVDRRDGPPTMSGIHGANLDAAIDAAMAGRG